MIDGRALLRVAANRLPAIRGCLIVLNSSLAHDRTHHAGQIVGLQFDRHGTGDGGGAEEAVGLIDPGPLVTRKVSVWGVRMG